MHQLSGRAAQAGKALLNHHSDGAGSKHRPAAPQPGMQPPQVLPSHKARTICHPLGSMAPLRECSTPLLACSLSLLWRKSWRLADVRRHHFTQRPGFLVEKGWGSGEEGEEEPGAKAASTSSSPCSHMRGSGRRPQGPSSFNHPCAREIETTSYFPALFPGAPAWSCHTEMQ